MATIADGRKIAEQILHGLKQELAHLTFQPLFCDVLIGDDPVSRSYVNIKARSAQQIGIEFQLVGLPRDIAAEAVVVKLKEIQKNPRLAGLIIQLPLPAGLDKTAIVNAVNPAVDVDCLSEINSKLFYLGQSKLLPPTAAAIMSVLDSLNLNLKQLDILVVGQGELVGRPVTFLLKQRGFRVRVADTSTGDLKELTRVADVVISGTGRAKLITGDMIKPGAAIIDCGTTESSGGIVGDVDLESVLNIAGFVSPVPGGVGPVTVARLLYNVVAVAKELKVK